MTDAKTSRKRKRSTVKIENIEEDLTDTRQASRRLVRSIIQTGGNLAMIPIRLLPSESQKHLENASREFALGITSLTREVLDVIEKMTSESD